VVVESLLEQRRVTEYVGRWRWCVEPEVAPGGGRGNSAAGSARQEAQPYEERLSQEKVVNIGAIGLPQSWHERYAPYAWSNPITSSQNKRRLKTTAFVSPRSSALAI